ncbi:MAG: hypothetical protein BGO76_08575 [Caedibacter sp. 38-128]|nr:hypothetical protein [Holosporales bacterium]OJX08109.1 MAG: hypothetical protein BGO76_08575 [Caedibacter sp. 38-128]
MKLFKILFTFISLWGQHQLGYATEEITPPSSTGRMPSLALIPQAQESCIARFLARKGVHTEPSSNDTSTPSPRTIPELFISEPSKEQAPPQEEKKSRRKKKKGSKKRHGELAPLEDPAKNFYTPKGNFYTPERKSLHEAQGLQKVGDIVTVTEVEQPDLFSINSSNILSTDSLLEKAQDVKFILSNKKKRGKKAIPDPSSHKYYQTLRKQDFPVSERLAKVNENIIPVTGKNTSDNG